MNVLIKREQSERAHFAKQEKGGMKFKFKFKIQQYQTDAVEQTVNVFAGQPSKTNAQYRRDLGKRKGQITFEEEYVGWRNNDVELQGHQLLANIQQQQVIGICCVCFITILFLQVLFEEVSIEGRSESPK